MTRIVVLLSGRGSNFEALLASCSRGEVPARIVAVLSNRPDAKGLETARKAGIATANLDHKAYPDRAAFDRALVEVVDAHAPDLVVLAGFMRILTEDFVRHYEGRLLNIHPSLLPAFTGLDTHQRALAEGVRIHGCTVHFVTAELDHGPIVIQAAVPVLESDTEASLAARVLAQEHRIYPLAVRWFAEGRLRLANGRVAVADAKPLAAALLSPEVA